MVETAEDWYGCDAPDFLGDVSRSKWAIQPRRSRRSRVISDPVAP